MKTIFAILLLSCLPMMAADKPKPPKPPKTHPCDVRGRHGKKPAKVKQGSKKVPREWVCDDSPVRDK